MQQNHNDDRNWLYGCNCDSCEERFTSGHDLVNHVTDEHKGWYIIDKWIDITLQNMQLSPTKI